MNFELPPLFSPIFPYFGNFVISPYFLKFPPDFVEFTCFLHTFVSPWFDHDAFMHHTMHVLDALALWVGNTLCALSDEQHSCG